MEDTRAERPGTDVSRAKPAHQIQVADTAASLADCDPDLFVPVSGWTMAKPSCGWPWATYRISDLGLAAGDPVVIISTDGARFDAHVEDVDTEQAWIVID